MPTTPSTTVNVVTNNVPRDIVEGYELTTAEREQFDYLDWASIDNGSDSGSFFRYKGDLHDLGEFMAWDNPASPTTRGNWDGYRSDTFFSGLVVRYVEDNERVVVGMFYAS